MHSTPPPTPPTGRLSRAIALLAFAGLAAPTVAQDWHWTGAMSDSWSNPGNWLFNSLPSEDGHAKLGSLDGVENDDVELDMSELIGALDIVDGMGLYTDNRSLRVSGDTLISGHNIFDTENGPAERHSTLNVGAVDGLSFMTHRLTVSDGGRYRLDNAYTRVNGRFGIDAESDFRGNGHVGLYGAPTALVNDGLIFPGSGMGIHLSQYNGGAIDLDGTSGDGVLFLASYDDDTDQGSKFRVDGNGLADAFSGRIVLVSNTDLFMNLADGWTADAGSEIIAGGSIDAPLSPALIRGGDFTFAGSMSVMHSNTEGYLRVQPSRFTLNPGAHVTLDPDTQADFGSPGTETVIKGGTCAVEEGAVLRMSGPTDWEGVFTSTGVVRQMAEATVTGPATIDAEVFDLDGSGLVTWNIRDPLLINAAAIDTPDSPSFDGTINITAGFLPALTLNLDDADAAWTLAGYMNLGGEPNIYCLRLRGSPMDHLGRLSVDSGLVAIESDVSFRAASTLVIDDAGAVLQMRGRSLVERDTAVNGQGTLSNGAAGRMTLQDGVDLGEVGLQNRGVLRIGAGAPGEAAVARFENAPDGLMRLEIGGYTAGAEHDTLAVAAEAQLGGRVEIELIDTGDGLFHPQPGDSFQILSAGSGIDGVFLEDPVTFSDGNIYEWRVIYGLKRVSVQLERITECAGDFNADGVIDTIDMIMFLNGWNAHDPAADINRDGLFDTTDFVAFLNLWADGC